MRYLYANISILQCFAILVHCLNSTGIMNSSISSSHINIKHMYSLENISFSFLWIQIKYLSRALIFKGDDVINIPANIYLDIVLRFTHMHYVRVVQCFIFQQFILPVGTVPTNSQQRCVPCAPDTISELTPCFASNGNFYMSSSIITNIPIMIYLSTISIYQIRFFFKVNTTTV